MVEARNLSATELSMSLKILLVDDSEADQHLLKSIIERNFPNCLIQSACDGADAISLLKAQENKVDIIFLDINMPGMNGYQFMEAYGEALIQDKILVYVLTSSSFKREAKLFSPYPCVVDLCSKSPSYDQVISIIDKHTKE